MKCLCAKFDVMIYFVVFCCKYVDYENHVEQIYVM